MEHDTLIDHSIEVFKVRNDQICTLNFCFKYMKGVMPKNRLKTMFLHHFLFRPSLFFFMGDDHKVQIGGYNLGRKGKNFLWLLALRHALKKNTFADYMA